MQIDEDSYPVNWIVDKFRKPDIVFSSAQSEQFKYLWHILATFPHKCILQYFNDVSSYFNQRQAHPNMFSANASIYKGYLI